MSRELDALVATKVMGWTDVQPGKALSDLIGRPEPKDLRTGVPRYSSDMAAAWEVVERMKELGWSFRYGNNTCASDQHAAAFAQSYRGLGAHILTGEYIEADNAVEVRSSAPLAICLAALKALGAEIPGGSDVR